VTVTWIWDAVLSDPPLYRAEFGTGPDGRLFVGDRNKKELPKGTVNQIWRRARLAVFIPEMAATPLAATPYDLRHAAVSTWLNGGVPPTDVAEWAGQSTEILFRIYAKCLDRGEGLLRRRVDAALGHDPDGKLGHAFGTDTRRRPALAGLGRTSVRITLP
jgi:integrase